MSRPLRIEFPGAVYHVPSRGDRRDPAYRDDADRTSHLAVIAQAMDWFDAQLLVYCQMGNHYHLALHTSQQHVVLVVVAGVVNQDVEHPASEQLVHLRHVDIALVFNCIN